MAVHGKFYNAYLSIGGVNLSARVRSVSVQYEAEELDGTAMGDTARDATPGLVKFKLDVEFNQDFAAANVHETIFPMVGAAPQAIVFRPDSGVKAPGNPELTGNAMVSNYNFGGAVGDHLNASVTLSGDGALASATA